MKPAASCLTKGIGEEFRVKAARIAEA